MNEAPEAEEALFHAASTHRTDQNLSSDAASKTPKNNQYDIISQNERPAQADLRHEKRSWKMMARDTRERSRKIKREGKHSVTEGSAVNR